MRRDRLLIVEMIGAAERIIELVGRRTAEDIRSDDLRRDALLWNFTVLGEAASQVSEEVTTSQAQLDWSDPVRLRNRIVHGYWSIDLDILVTTAKDDLPRFVADLRTVEQALNVD